MEAHFALSWVLTWFAHVYDEFDDVCRIFDFVLATHPLAPVYLSTAVSACNGSCLYGSLTVVMYR